MNYILPTLTSIQAHSHEQIVQLAGLPAGVGLATARAIFKLWLGISPSRSGVASAGNGPAMRSAVIGVFFANDTIRRHQFVEASSQSRASTNRPVGDSLKWLKNPPSLRFPVKILARPARTVALMPSFHG